MTTLNNDAKRAALVVGGVSAVVCASAAYYYLKNKKPATNSNKKNLSSSSSASKTNDLLNLNCTENESKKLVEKKRNNNKDINVKDLTVGRKKSSSVLSSSEEEEEEEEELTEGISDSSLCYSSAPSANNRIGSANNKLKSSKNMLPVVRGGRKNYRAMKKCQDFTGGSSAVDKIDSRCFVANGQQQLRSASSFTQQQHEQTDEEVNARRLAAEFSSKINLSSSSSITTPRHSEDIGDLSASMIIRPDSGHSPSPKGQCADSPSLASDGRSEGSQDSGKGTSTAFTSSISPVEELIEIPPVYEFEIPQDIVGLVIGTKGQTIKWFTGQSGAQMIIRRHYASDRHKICTIEGSREQINKCLRLIRRKFPPSRFPELKLTPLLAPAVSSSRTPVCDSIIRLNLPQGVKCEVVVSSLVDPGNFFLQQPTHPTFPSLTRLDQCMLAVYSQMLGVPALPRPIDIGVICAAPVLGGWYRAQTIETYDDTDEVLVKFVDYGGYSKIQANDLRQIRSDLMSLPFQANECSLAHVKPADDAESWSAEATAFFEQCTQGKVVEALVVGQTVDNVTSVELYCNVDSETNEPIMLNRFLADNGYAHWHCDSPADIIQTSTPNYYCPQFV